MQENIRDYRELDIEGLRVRKNECLREFDVKNFLGLLSIYRVGWVLSLQRKKKEKI